MIGCCQLAAGKDDDLMFGILAPGEEVRALAGHFRVIGTVRDYVVVEQ